MTTHEPTGPRWRRRVAGVAAGGAIGLLAALADVVRCRVRPDGAEGAEGVALLAAGWLLVGAAAGGAAAQLAPRRRLGVPGATLAIVLGVAALGATDPAAHPGAPASVPLHAPPGAPDVLLVLVDTLRADHLGLAGYARPTSPRLDALAASAVVFEQARAQSSYTRPSTASLLTSLFPSQHGHGGAETARLADALDTLPEVLHRHGWVTGGFSANPWIAPQFGFDQGFDVFETFDDVGPFRASLLLTALRRTDAALGRAVGHASPLRLGGVRRRLEGVTGNARRDRAVVRGVTRWLATLPADRPYFAYVHLMSPHIPYDPADDARRAVAAHPTRVVPETPPPGAGCYRPGTPVDDARREELIALYDAAIRDADRAVGALLDAVAASGRGDRTVVVVTADHGEEFFEHHGWSHGQSLHEELIRVPLLVRVPGMSPRRVPAPVMSVDVMPTVLAAAGIRPDAALAGRDLGGLLRGAGAAPRPVFSEIVSPRCRSEAVVADGWKQLVWSREDAAGEATFDLGADPAEARPVADAVAGAGLRALREAHHVTAVARGAAVGERTGIAAEQRDRLRALGYLADDADAR